ncbi:M23 family metallopeptidase [Bacteroides reticulotermitis]|uniref:M23 family metallopeptidase n=1 Tax=Bacteroides reticulotermitis TaxID=1133319 RepID=UPI0005C686F6|nr:M23 family metallopeptidase [Bacteroides reticulotermitis]
MHPVRKKRVLHAGVDIAAPYGTPVYASGNGKVVEARYSSSYGWYVEIRHAGGFSTLYAHLSKMYVKKGNDVRMGRHIGNVGHTGIATGNHLHFELRKNGKPQNPLQWVILRDSRYKKSH